MKKCLEYHKIKPNKLNNALILEIKSELLDKIEEHTWKLSDDHSAGLAQALWHHIVLENTRKDFVLVIGAAMNNPNYSHLSNNRGGWNKRVGVQKLQNQLDFFCQFLS